MVSTTNCCLNYSNVPLGTWQCAVPFPESKSLLSLVTNLTGENKEAFADFVSGFLRWLPEERMTRSAAYLHSWLRGTPEGQADVENPT